MVSPWCAIIGVGVSRDIYALKYGADIGTVLESVDVPADAHTDDRAPGAHHACPVQALHAAPMR